MVRTLVSEDNSTARGKEERQRELKGARKQHYGVLVRSFLSGLAMLLLKRDQTEQEIESRGRQLFEEIYNAGELSCKLLSQRSIMKCLGLRGFLGKDFRKLRPEYTRVHPLSGHGDDDMHLHNSLPIRMVVQPGIVAYGNEEGENYSQPPRVWLQALVWVEYTEAEEAETTSTQKRRKSEKEREAVEAPESRRTQATGTSRSGAQDSKVGGH